MRIRDMTSEFFEDVWGKPHPLGVTMHTKHVVKHPPQKTDEEYIHLWRIVDGAVKDAFAHHKDYLNPKVSHRVVRNSVNKRVVGAIRASLRQANGRSNEGLE